MFKFTRLSTDHLYFPPDQVLLRSEDYELYISAKALLSQAQDDAQALDAEARDAYEEQVRLGWQAGMEEANAERAELIHHTLMQCQQFCEQMEERLADVVLQAVRKLIADYPMGERVAKATRDGLALLGDGARVALHVHPQEVATVREGLECMGSSVRHIDVVAAPSAQLGDCILESEIGSVDIGTETQLRALKDALLQTRARVAGLG